MSEIYIEFAGGTKSYSIPDGAKVSDGYHTFDELYEHRFALWIALCRAIESDQYHQYQYTHEVWRSKLNSDGTAYEGWFLLGISYDPGKQISYHLPMSRWDECDFATILDRPTFFDGHTSADVLQRLKEL